MKLLDKFFNNCCGVPCRIMTWEHVAPFEGSVQESDVLNQIGVEMPSMVQDPNVKLWPMISFNGPEGRVWRYLVIFGIQGENLPAKHMKKRWLPEQIGLMGAADLFLKQEQEGNSGNAVFFAVIEEKLYLFVYFEGRLCHWSEELGYSKGILKDEPSKTKNPPEDKPLNGTGNANAVQDRLERFQQFLKQDSLFSRGMFSNFIELDSGCCSRENFARISRDPFFRKLRLNEPSKNVYGSGKKSKLFLTLFIVLCICWWAIPRGQHFQYEIPDVAPVELEEPSFVEEIIEPRESPVEKSSPPADQKKANPLELVAPPCVLPSFRIKGVVGGALAILEMRGSGQTVLLEDSVGDFTLSHVGRDRLTFACRDSLLEVKLQ